MPKKSATETGRKRGEKVFPCKLVLNSKLEILDMLGCEEAEEVFNQASYARVNMYPFPIKMLLGPVFPPLKPTIKGLKEA